MPPEPLPAMHRAAPPARAPLVMDAVRRHSEIYRGYRIVVERVVVDDGGGACVRCTLSRRLGERYAAVLCRDTRLPSPAGSGPRAFDDALREAREAVDRLLGGWHPAYAQAGAEAAPASMQTHARGS